MFTLFEGKQSLIWVKILVVLRHVWIDAHFISYIRTIQRHRYESRIVFN